MSYDIAEIMFSPRTNHPDWKETRSIPNSQAFQRGSVRCIVSLDGPEKLWHISISCQHRYPHWDEIKKARYDLVPDEVTMAMILPPRSEYVNIHPNCFHLHELREGKLITLVGD